MGGVFNEQTVIERVAGPLTMNMIELRSKLDFVVLFIPVTVDTCLCSRNCLQPAEEEKYNHLMLEDVPNLETLEIRI